MSEKVSDAGKYAVLEKFIKGEQIEEISPVVEYIRSFIFEDSEFFAYLRSKYPYKIIREAKLWGHRGFLLVEWMGKYYPCWTTGHSSIKGVSAFNGIFAIEHDKEVYAASGEGQYWESYNDFNGCVTLEDFNKRINELEAERPSFSITEFPITVDSKNNDAVPTSTDTVAAPVDSTAKQPTLL